MPDDDLDAVVRQADPDRWLASRFIADRAARADVVALYAFDHHLARARRVASNPLIAEIRLAWWREVLDEVFAGNPVRAHPVALALAAAQRRHDLPRSPLEAMIDARIDTLGKAALNEGESLSWSEAVGGSAAILAATILGATQPILAAAAGRLWGLVLLGRQGLVGGADLDQPLRAILPIARRDARRLGVSAFPAVAHATLARARAHEGALVSRLRLLWAVSTGRL